MVRKVLKGFTLIELMIVVAIIGILAAIAIPNFVKFQCRSKQSEAKTNLKAMYVAQESYRGEFDDYVQDVATNFENGGTNVMGFYVRGTNLRYAYTSATGGTGAGVTFLGTATGDQGDVSGDIWTITEGNVLTNTTNLCD